jgi:ADP-ribose pyrophosphatase
MTDSTVKSTLGEGRYLRLVVRDGWEYVERSVELGLVCILALTPDDEIVLVEQYRPPIGKRVIELPAGLVGDSAESRGEPLLRGAQRELEEETGYRASEWRVLIEGPPSAGISTEVLTVFVALGLERVGPGGGDEHETITVWVVPRAELVPWLESRRSQGASIDLKIFSALWLYEHAR